MGLEQVGKAISEVAKSTAEVAKSASKDIDKRIDVKNLSNEKLTKDVEKSKIKDIDGRIDVSKKSEKLYTTYKERINRTPKNNWSENRGESLYKVQDSEAQKYLKSKNLDGIEYKNAIPDFDKVSEGTCRIPKMSEYREDYYDAEKKCYIEGNFTQYDKIMKKKLEDKGFQIKDIKCDDGRVRKIWFDSKGVPYTRHEKVDMKTMQLVPFAIHKECKHSGGVAEIKAFKKNNNE